MIVGVPGVALMSDSNLLSQTASCPPVLSATYSASVVDKATTGCFLLSQLIAHIMNKLPVVE